MKEGWPIPLPQYKEAFDDSESEPVMKLMWFVCVCVCFALIEWLTQSALMQRYKTIVVFLLDVRGHGWGVGVLGAGVIPGALWMLTLFPICPVFEANHPPMAAHSC